MSPMELPTDDRFSVPPQPEIWRTPPRGNVVCFAPHPDDEAAGPGGALCLHRLQGDRVRVVLATDGAAGDPEGRYPKAAYPEMRRHETRAGMRVLGIEAADIVFWGFLDSCVITEGDLDHVSQLVAQQVKESQADVVYLPWEGEGNSDHRALYCGVVRGLRRMGFPGLALGYEIWNAMVPDVVLDITAVAARKREAMLCYPTQLAYVEYLHPIFGLNAHRSMLFNQGRGFGEAYRRVQVR